MAAYNIDIMVGKTRLLALRDKRRRRRNEIFHLFIVISGSRKGLNFSNGSFITPRVKFMFLSNITTYIRLD